jgi:cyanate permease
MFGQMMTMVATPLSLLVLQTAQADSDQMTPDQKFEIAREAIRHGHGQGFEDVLVPLAFFAAVVMIVWLANRRKQVQAQSLAEVRKQVLAKFESAQELAAFMDSKGGQQFLGVAEHRSGGQMRCLPAGLVTTMLGLAFLGLTIVQKHFIIPAALLLAVGIGLLLSAAIAHKLASSRKDETIEPGSGTRSFPSA